MASSHGHLKIDVNLLETWLTHSCKETKFLSFILVTTESPQDDNIACLYLLISPYLAFWTLSIGHQVKLNEYVFVFTKIL